MRILLAARFFYSGQTTHLVELARALNERGHRVTLLTTGRCHIGAWELYSHPLALAGVDCARTETMAEALARGCGARPDVVHCHSSDLLPLALQIGRRAGGPVVFTCHGLGVAASRPEIHLADRVIAVGPNVRAELVRSGIVHTALIGNGVDLSRFKPGNKPRPLRIAYVGRVDSSKRPGLQELIAAVARIPGAQLWVAANDRPLSKACTSLGWVGDVAPLLAQSHVVVGTGRAIREGMASGCVGMTLGARYAGVVSPGKAPDTADGFPSFSGSDGYPPERGMLRRDLAKLFHNAPHRRALARWSRTYAYRHFSLAAMTDAVVNLYSEAIERCVAL